MKFKLGNFWRLRQSQRRCNFRRGVMQCSCLLTCLFCILSMSAFAEELPPLCPSLEAFTYNTAIDETVYLHGAGIWVNTIGNAGTITMRSDLHKQWYRYETWLSRVIVKPYGRATKINSSPAHLYFYVCSSDTSYGSHDRNYIHCL